MFVLFIIRLCCIKLSGNGSGVSDEEMLSVSACSSIKRRKFSRERDATKLLWNTTHKTGKDCQCKRLKCFENFIGTERNGLISIFNALRTWNDQSSYLAGSISVQPVARCRPTKPLDEVSLNDFSYEYKVQVVHN